MGLEKAIKYGKERRKPYRKSKRFDRTCRNHGACPYCKDQRTFFDKKERMKADQELKDFKKGVTDINQCEEVIQED